MRRFSKRRNCLALLSRRRPSPNEPRRCLHITRFARVGDSLLHSSLILREREPTHHLSLTSTLQRTETSIIEHPFKPSKVVHFKVVQNDIFYWYELKNWKGFIEILKFYFILPSISSLLQYNAKNKVYQFWTKSYANFWNSNI